MKKSFLFILITFVAFAFSKAQTTAMQVTGADCNGNPMDFFADLDSGKIIILHFFMPNCAACPPVAQRIQAMAGNVNAMHPGMVKGYAFPYNNSATCVYSTSWVSTNGLYHLYSPVDSGASQVAYYGGFGMPTVVVLGGTDHRVLFSTLSFSTSDTAQIRDSIMAVLEGSPSGINKLSASVSNFSVSPNPANNLVSIIFNLNYPSSIVVDVTDITGKQVAVIMNEKQQGVVTKQFNTDGLPNGNYLIRLQTNGKTVTQKLAIAH